MIVGASYSHTDILKFDSLYDVFYTPYGLLLKFLKVPNAFELKTSHTSVQFEEQRS